MAKNNISYIEKFFTIIIILTAFIYFSISIFLSRTIGYKLFGFKFKDKAKIFFEKNEANNTIIPSYLYFLNNENNILDITFNNSDDKWKYKENDEFILFSNENNNNINKHINDYINDNNIKLELDIDLHNKNSKCYNCISSEPYEIDNLGGGPFNIKAPKIKIKKGALFVIWSCFILGTTFIINYFFGILDFIIKIPFLKKIVCTLIFLSLTINIVLLFTILKLLDEKCKDKCSNYLKIDLLDNFTKIKALSATITPIMIIVTLLLLFAPSAFDKLK